MQKRDAKRFSVGSKQATGNLGISRRMLENNIQMVVRERGCDGTDWFHLAKERDKWKALVSTIMNIRAPQNVGKFLNS
jgi:hypothetical protein